MLTEGSPNSSNVSDATSFCDSPIFKKGQEFTQIATPPSPLSAGQMHSRSQENVLTGSLFGISARTVLPSSLHIRNNKLKSSNTVFGLLEKQRKHDPLLSPSYSDSIEKWSESVPLIIEQTEAALKKLDRISIESCPENNSLKENTSNGKDNDSSNCDPFDRERKQYESRLAELVRLTEPRKIEIERLTFQLKNLRDSLDKTQKRCDHLHVDNCSLREQLTVLGYESKSIPDSDKSNAPSHRKLQRIVSGFDGQGTKRSESVGGMLYPSNTPQSSDGSNTESVTDDKAGNSCGTTPADLQVRLTQMEEDNYSTTEELQATLQELGDLQKNIDDASEENNALSFERAVLLESLCTQTQKLENCRLQIDNLKFLLVTDKATDNRSECEAKFFQLYNLSETEKKEAIQRGQELSQSVESLDRDNRVLRDKYGSLKGSYDHLESQYDKLCADQEDSLRIIDELRFGLAELKRSERQWANEQCQAVAKEAGRVTKEAQLESLLAVSEDKNDRLQKEMLSLKEQCDAAQHEKKEASVLENKLKTTKSQSETLLATMRDDMRSMERETERLRKQLAAQSLELSKTVSTKRELTSVHETLAKVRASLADLTEMHKRDTQSWDQYEKDLLLAVRVADGIKMEAECEVKSLKAERQDLKSQMAGLQERISALSPVEPPVKPAPKPPQTLENSPCTPTANDIRGRVMTSVDREFASLRRCRRTSTASAAVESSSTVKNLIQIIEMQISNVVLEDPNTPTSATSPVKASASTTSPKSLRRSNSQRQTRTGLVNSKIAASVSQLPARKAVTSAIAASPCRIDSVIIHDRVPPLLNLGVNITPPSSSRHSSMKAGRPPLATSLQRSTSEAKPIPPPTPVERQDPLQALVKASGGSRRNALLSWCQTRTRGYPGVDITNFSSSWTDGLALSALIHSYLPDKMDLSKLVRPPTSRLDRQKNLELGFAAAESIGVYSALRLDEVLACDRPDWNVVMTYVTAIYSHFENSADSIVDK